MGLSKIAPAGMSYTPVNKAGDTMTGDLDVPSLNNGQLSGFRNKIINGKMEIAQRGTSFTSAVNGSFVVDRFVMDHSSTAVLTISQQTDVPASSEFQNSSRIAVTTADTSIAAGDYFQYSQKIEGYNARDLVGRTFTLSFWVKSSKTGIHCISFRNGSADRTYVSEYIITAANTWEYKSITVVNGLPVAGTWNWTNGIGLTVTWALACGTTYHTSANSWNSGNFLTTSNQVNVLDTIGNIFALTGVQLEIGEKATPFEHRNYSAELALCQRYFVSNLYLEIAGYTTNGCTEKSTLSFPVEMRSTPTMVNSSFCSVGLISNFAVSAATAKSFGLSGLGTGTAGYILSTMASASAEL